MSIFFIAVGFLTLLLAAGHSLLGEHLIFRDLRSSERRQAALALFPQRRWDALRSTWHLISILALGISFSFFTLGLNLNPTKHAPVIAIILSATFAVCCVYWAVGTRGKHPAFWVFGLIAVLIYLGAFR